MTTPTEERGADVHFPPPLVFVIAIAIGWAIDRFTYPLAIGPSPAVRAFGAALIICGVGLIGWAVKLFRATGQDPEPWKPSPEMIARGPYRYTRNPMYVGMTLIQLGVGFAMNNVWVIILAPISLLCVHFIAVLPEEKYLGEKFGESYRVFRSSVRRYL